MIDFGISKFETYKHILNRIGTAFVPLSFSSVHIKQKTTKKCKFHVFQIVIYKEKTLIRYENCDGRSQSVNKNTHILDVEIKHRYLVYIYM